MSDTNRIESWKEWFDLCGDLNGDIYDYEGVMYNHMDEQLPKKQKQLADMYFGGRRDKDFYKEPIKPSRSKIFEFIGTALIGFIIIFIIVFGLQVVLNLKDITLVPFLIKAAVAGVAAFALIMAVLVLRFKSKMGKIVKQLDELTARLEEDIAYIPVKYRNSFSTLYFFNKYLDSDETKTFEEIKEALDKEIENMNDMEGPTIPIIMADVEYKKPDFMVDKSRDTYQEDPSLLNDPNLPQDIVTKTFKGVSDADNVLSGLIGMDKVKTQVRQMKNRADFFKESGGSQASGNHMVFLGPAGSGKTTIARIITGILYDSGYIKKNKCVEVDGSYLKSPFAGQTSNRVNAIIKYSLGGVLFIDEAYTLIEGGESVGAESIGVLLKAMEDYRDDLIIIFAGYEDNINRLLASNEGFASRIKYKIYFEDYTGEELLQIFKKMLMNFSGTDAYTITSEAADMLKTQFERESGSPSFGNARVVRNAVDLILDAHADRFQKGELNENDRYVITSGDIEVYVSQRSKQLEDDKRNFMAQNNIESSIISYNELKSRTKQGSSNPDKDLNRMIGLSRVKEEVNQMKAEFDFYEGEIQTEGNHMCFIGPPGTGKSTLAAIMTGYLYNLGLIRENKFLDINGDFLRASYLGQTGKRTEAVVQFCRGMVLFIDETYLLSVDKEGDQYGKEAIGVLLDAMEKNRKDFVVIFAGYEKEMNTFLEINSGLKSRIRKFFHFESYSPKEIATIFNGVARASGFTVERDVWIPLQRYTKEQLENPLFANGRFARSMFEDIKRIHISNYAKSQDESKKYSITQQDFNDYLASKQ